MYILLLPDHTLFFLQLIQDIFKRLSLAFLIFPQFNFGNGLMELTRIDIEVQLLSGYGIDAYKNPYSLDALGWMLISSIIQGLVFFMLRLLLNKFITRKIRWGSLLLWVNYKKKTNPIIIICIEHFLLLYYYFVGKNAKTKNIHPIFLSCS